MCPAEARRETGTRPTERPSISNDCGPAKPSTDFGFVLGVLRIRCGCGHRQSGPASLAGGGGARRVPMLKISGAWVVSGKRVHGEAPPRPASKRLQGW